MHKFNDLRWIVLVLVGNLAISLLNVRYLAEGQRWVSHTYEVRSALDGAVSGTVQAESGYRGFLLTREDDFLDPYRDGARHVNNCVERLKTLTADNVAQQQSIPTLRDAVRDKLSLIDQTIRAADSPKDVSRLVHAGRIAMSRVRLVAQQMLSEEDRLMRERHERLRNSYLWMVANILTFSLLVVIVLVMLIARRSDSMAPAKTPNHPSA